MTKDDILSLVVFILNTYNLLFDEPDTINVTALEEISGILIWIPLYFPLSPFPERKSKTLTEYVTIFLSL